MNVPAHMSGPFSGQEPTQAGNHVAAHMSGSLSGLVPTQAGNQLSVMPQQNGNLYHSQVQNLSGQSNPQPMDPEVIKIRKFLRERIYVILMRKQSPHSESISRKCQEYTVRLEDGLFKSATTKEEYLNLETLETRISALLNRRTAATNRTTQHSQVVNNAAPVATMMPTPGMQQNGYSNIMASSAAVDPIMMSGNTGGNLMPVVSGSNSAMRGGSFQGLSNIYQQQASSFSMNSGGNNMMVGQRPMSHMIPTPGFSGRNNQSMNAVGNYNNGMLSSGDSSLMPQQVPYTQVNGPNNRMVHNFGGGMKPLLQPGLQNGTLNSGFGNNVQMVNGSALPDTHLATSSFGASSGPLIESHETLQRPITQGYSSGSGNVYNNNNIGDSAGSLMNNQNLDQTRTSLPPRHNSIVNNQLDSHLSQPASYMRPQLAEQMEKVNFQPRENHLQTSTRQYQEHIDQIPAQQQFTAYSQQRQPNELSQISIKNEAFQSHVGSDFGSHVKSENGLEHQNVGFQQVSSQHIHVPKPENQPLYDSNGNLLRNPQLSSLPYAEQSEALPSPMLIDEHNVKKEYCQRTNGNDLYSGVQNQIVIPERAVDELRITGGASSANVHREQDYRNQLRWLLFLRHARWCRALAGKCAEPCCIKAQKFVEHLDNCEDNSCSYPRCAVTKRLLIHQRDCRDVNCPVCVPYKKFIYTHKKLCARPVSINGSCKSLEAEEIKPKENITLPEKIVALPNDQPPVKRPKSDLTSQFMSSLNACTLEVNVSSGLQAPQSMTLSKYEENDNYMQIEPEHKDLKAEIPSVSNHIYTETKNTIVDIASNQRLDGRSTLNHVSSLPKEETVKLVKDNVHPKAEEVIQASGTKSGKPKIKGVSLIELFTPEQVRDHITVLRRWIGQSRAKAEKNQAMEQTMSENSCQLCAAEKLSFEPPPIYCTPCGARVKRNAMYYTFGTGDTRHYFCIPCYNETRGDSIPVDGTPIPKGRMEKKKNDEETEEWWVQCDKCEAWQHQICALFNGKRNDGGQADYTCPNCYVQEVERGERMPLPQSTVLGAKDLPTTVLSDHIEKRLAKRLKQERLDRARSQGKSYDEVPGADGIVVRVVSSVDKKLEVKPRFLDIFREENYPLEFPYKSKAVLLFQKIEGVEVCLYSMYVQEFGSECLPPNQRRVYLSYLDSVKYFRPEVKTVTGEALRTFVYHEILIGYLEYCKNRGFASCYIWACPPLKGEDYILYCHPEIQKTPKSDKLREWYLAMLKKAIRENIVVGLTNLYEHFFIQSGESKAKVTAARLPYFDGDYWPGSAEDMISQIYQDEEDRKMNKKGLKKMITKRALKASGQFDLSSNASKDIILMHKLGEMISPMKEDFIMVHLQHACSYCCKLMVSGNRWVCEQCKNFQLCDRCYGEDQKRDYRERHPTHQKIKHGLKKTEITDVPEDTKDKDDILESEFFDTRQAFLSLCQGNHYQYDTLRRAKHSSMMVLYHLHNPTAPAFVATCNICHLDIETGQGWRCETCPDYDVCNGCYQKDGCVKHPHKLVNQPNIADGDSQNKEARQQRVSQLRKMLELLVHASVCRSAQCRYPDCRKVKGLFRHGMHCKTRASGGCGLCKRMWYLLQVHARACKESNCTVPRCRDLNDHMRRVQQQSDSRRRIAVMEMMRQRAKEIANGD